MQQKKNLCTSGRKRQTAAVHQPCRLTAKALSESHQLAICKPPNTITWTMGSKPNRDLKGKGKRQQLVVSCWRVEVLFLQRTTKNIDLTEANPPDAPSRGWDGGA